MKTRKILLIIAVTIYITAFIAIPLGHLVINMIAGNVNTY